jgi:hypothetical protein
MEEFPAKPTRLDPYKNFNFRLKWDGKYVGRRPGRRIGDEMKRQERESP